MSELKDEFIGEMMSIRMHRDQESAVIQEVREFDPVPVNVKMDYTVSNAEDVIFWATVSTVR